ncbi:ribosome small subunit-dependent GTPase A [Paenibacillus radicis (ex Xue et al. 2023)]|uniref:Small ribosomal subunit biogenesis GTPase RsgA n=1 Tax=Paenibacillus radicis (ex Xue et al. 2023) TaxID=2972489 RepID=A0ABT1Y986_9BACL|nr:ribosome small subunit-dependent GTPase A [Paenibacillus radicis (ex Xue et al. 2023)]MCR8629753.1 ribosome small subunit-dependent GTPase A [Paenibacillus radicis (ex Xue et al. 2023)]
MENNHSLETYGFQPFFANQDKEGCAIGRVALEHKHLYRIYAEDGEWLGELSGKTRYEAVRREDYPAVGDWVRMTKLHGEQKAIIHGILERKSKFSRKAAGSTTEEQIVATNVDRVFLVMALNRDFNVRRLERYLLLGYESGAAPEIVLTKKDLCDDLETRLREVESIAFGVPIYSVNSLADDGIEEIAASLRPGETIALLGSSGAGKSTLLNSLYGGQRQKTGGVRDGDDRGKHTTTHRELVVLPSGALIIDTPGMRELQLWEGSESIGAAFHDVEELAAGCRYSDCRHEQEPGCMIRSALADGTLSQERISSYYKLQKELAYNERKINAGAARAEKDRWKKIHKNMRSNTNH